MKQKLTNDFVGIEIGIKSFKRKKTISSIPHTVYPLFSFDFLFSFQPARLSFDAQTKCVFSSN